MERTAIVLIVLTMLLAAATGMATGEDGAWFKIRDMDTGEELHVGDVITTGEKRNGACHADTATSIRITSNTTASLVAMRTSPDEDCDVIVDDVVSIRGGLSDVLDARDTLALSKPASSGSQDSEETRCTEENGCQKANKSVSAETYVEYRTYTCNGYKFYPWWDVCDQPSEDSYTRTKSTLFWTVDCYGTDGCMTATYKSQRDDCSASSLRYWAIEACNVISYGDYIHDDCCDHAWMIHEGSYTWVYSEKDYDHWRANEPVGHGNGYHMECSYYASGWAGDEEINICLEYSGHECWENREGDETCRPTDCRNCDDVERPG